MGLRIGSLKELEAAVRACTRCPLHAGRRNAVPGEGPRDAKVMVVGEAPGKAEDEQGRPFVGPAGRLLNRLLELAGLKREQVYITNVVKCRPPGNRDPKPEEIAACRPYLEAQISLVKPRLIIAVGRIAGRTLYEMAGLKWSGIRAARGRLRSVTIAGHSTMLIVTYHPAAALYNASLRGELEADFSGPIKRAVEAALGGGASGKRGRTLEDFMS